MILFFFFCYKRMQWCIWNNLGDVV